MIPDFTGETLHVHIFFYTFLYYYFVGLGITAFIREHTHQELEHLATALISLSSNFMLHIASLSLCMYSVAPLTQLNSVIPS